MYNCDNINWAACRCGAERASLFVEVSRKESGLFVSQLVGGWMGLSRLSDQEIVNKYACDHLYLISNASERRGSIIKRSTYDQVVDKLQKLGIAIEDQIDEDRLLIRARRLKISIADYVNGYNGD